MPAWLSTMAGAPPREERGKIPLRPDHGVGQIQCRADGHAVGGEVIGRHAHDREFIAAQAKFCDRRAEGLAGGAVGDVAEHGDAGRPQACDGFREVIKLRLVVADVDDGRGAAGEGGEHREVHRARAAAGDDVAVFERVAVEQDGQRQAGVLGLEAVDRRDHLRRALIGRVLVAGDDQQGLGHSRRQANGPSHAAEQPAG
jgi:hypothetical protein